MKLCARVCALFILAACLHAEPAVADSTATSTISQMKILASGDKNYKLFHGAVWLEYDKAKHNYRWGGAHCAGDGLTETQVGMLFAAFRSRYNITLDYKNQFYKSRAYRCITGFTLSRK